MKKKKLITMLTTLVLVTVVGVGATLAYFTDTTQALTNTFAVGNNVSLELRETDIENENEFKFADNENTGEQNYENMLPGVFVKKDPYIVVGDNTSDCYLFIQLSNFDNNLNIRYSSGNDGIINSHWVKVTSADGLNGIYMYKVGDDNIFSENTVTEAIFDEIKLLNGFSESETEIKGLTIKACAYQSSGVDFNNVIAKDDYQALKNLFN